MFPNPRSFRARHHVAGVALAAGATLFVPPLTGIASAGELETSAECLIGSTSVLSEIELAVAELQRDDQELAKLVAELRAALNLTEGPTAAQADAKLKEALAMEKAAVDAVRKATADNDVAAEAVAVADKNAAAADAEVARLNDQLTAHEAERTKLTADQAAAEAAVTESQATLATAADKVAAAEKAVAALDVTAGDIGIRLAATAKRAAVAEKAVIDAEASLAALSIRRDAATANAVARQRELVAAEATLTAVSKELAAADAAIQTASASKIVAVYRAAVTEKSAAEAVIGDKAATEQEKANATIRLGVAEGNIAKYRDDAEAVLAAGAGAEKVRVGLVADRDAATAAVATAAAAQETTAAAAKAADAAVETAQTGLDSATKVSAESTALLASLAAERDLVSAGLEKQAGVLTATRATFGKATAAADAHKVASDAAATAAKAAAGAASAAAEGLATAQLVATKSVAEQAAAAATMSERASAIKKALVLQATAAVSARDAEQQAIAAKASTTKRDALLVAARSAVTRAAERTATSSERASATAGRMTFGAEADLAKASSLATSAIAAKAAAVAAIDLAGASTNATKQTAVRSTVEWSMGDEMIELARGESATLSLALFSGATVTRLTGSADHEFFSIQPDGGDGCELIIDSACVLPGTHAIEVLVDRGDGSEPQVLGITVVVANNTEEERTAEVGAALDRVGEAGDESSYAVVSGSLPNGVSLNADGTFLGEPSEPGTYVLGIEVTRPDGSIETVEMTLVVDPIDFVDAPPGALAFTGTTSTPVALVGGTMILLGWTTLAARRRFLVD